jgi:NO-binding membrane sensor protein with MHYT domain
MSIASYDLLLVLVQLFLCVLGCFLNLGFETFAGSV